VAVASVASLHLQHHRVVHPEEEQEKEHLEELRQRLDIILISVLCRGEQ